MRDNYTIRKLCEEDWAAVTDIFNFFAKESYAVYCESPVSVEYFKKRTEEIKIALVIETVNKVIGFGFISRYKPFPNFSQTGVLTYFILPEYTGKGLGTKLMNEIISKGKELGITNYLAHISSKNEQSLNFHLKHGFETAGRFKNIAYKFNEPFDIIWVQKQFDEVKT